MSEYYSEQTVKGRRGYTCHGCRKPIDKGALHVCVSIGTGDKHHTHRAHIDCHEAATGQPAPAHASAARERAAARRFFLRHG